MVDCVLPEDMILCILICLPVKSILRFRSVCKLWHKLLSSPQFLQMHFHQFPGDSKSKDFIMSDCNTVSLFNIECNGRKPRNLNFGDPYPMMIVGCCKGLVCMCDKSLGEIYLWNPALNLSKYVPPSSSGVVLGASSWSSLGFGYDDDVADFKVVKIVFLEKEKKVDVEVYSAKSDSWQTIEVGFRFYLFLRANDVIVNGNPCWGAVVLRVGERASEECVLWFDVKKLVFNIVPLPEYITQRLPPLHVFMHWKPPYLVGWKGSLAVIGYTYEVESIYVLVLDEGEMIWRLNHISMPTEMKRKRGFLRCSDNGKFIGDSKDGKFVLFDFESACVKVIEIHDALSGRFYGYSESLVYIEGMEPVVVKKGGKKRGLRGRQS